MKALRPFDPQEGASLCSRGIWRWSFPPRDKGAWQAKAHVVTKVLLCHVRDWRDPAEAQANASCPGVTYDQDSRQVTLRRSVVSDSLQPHRL